MPCCTVHWSVVLANSSSHWSFVGVFHPAPQLKAAGSSLACKEVRSSVKPLLPYLDWLLYFVSLLELPLAYL
jgi:hypothetical protein